MNRFSVYTKRAHNIITSSSSSSNATYCAKYLFLLSLWLELWHQWVIAKIYCCSVIFGRLVQCCHISFIHFVRFTRASLSIALPRLLQTPLIAIALFLSVEFLLALSDFPQAVCLFLLALFLLTYFHFTRSHFSEFSQIDMPKWEMRKCVRYRPGQQTLNHIALIKVIICVAIYYVSPIRWSNHFHMFFLQSQPFRTLLFNCAIFYTLHLHRDREKEREREKKIEKKSCRSKSVLELYGEMMRVCVEMPSEFFSFHRHIFYNFALTKFDISMENEHTFWMKCFTHFVCHSFSSSTHSLS